MLICIRLHNCSYLEQSSLLNKYILTELTIYNSKNKYKGSYIMICNLFKINNILVSYIPLNKTYENNYYST